jgi:shikimate dehydrogenase
VLYKPSPTKLSEAWLKHGGNVINGLDLLVEQALDQIHLMTGASFDYAWMRTALLEEVRIRQSQG